MVALLRRGSRTVEELAKAVGLTNNGVRAHLATLERDGLVRQGGTVRPASGGGKPAYVYELTSEAEGLFPRAYEPVLGRLLDVLSEGLGPQESEALLRGVGRRMAEVRGTPEGGARARTEEAVAVLNELGGLAELEERDGDLAHPGVRLPTGRGDPGPPRGVPHGRDPDRGVGGRVRARALRARGEAALLFRGDARREYCRARIAKFQDPRRGPLPLGPSKRGYLTERGGVPCVVARIGVDAAALLEESLVLEPTATRAQNRDVRAQPHAGRRGLILRFGPMVCGGISSRCCHKPRRVSMRHRQI